MCLLRLPLGTKVQLYFPFVGLLYHLIQGFSPCEAHKLPDIIPQHGMISCPPHVLIGSVLWDQQCSFPKLGGDLRHSLGGLLKVMKLPHKALHLNVWSKLHIESPNKRSPCHLSHAGCSHLAGHLSPHQSRALSLSIHEAKPTFTALGKELVCWAFSISTT